MSNPVSSPSLLAISVRNFHSYILAGLLGGLLIMLLEATDRLIVLPFNTNLDRVLFISTLALAPIGNIVLGIFIGILASKAKFLLSLLEQQTKFSSWIKYSLVALSVSIPFLLLIFFVPSLFANPFQDLLIGLGKRGLPLGKVTSYSKLLLSLLIYLVTLKIAFLESDWFNELIKTRLAIVLFSLAVLIMGAFYYLDSRTFVGRYQSIYHLPLGLGVILVSIFSSLIVIRRLDISAKYVILAILPAFIFTFSHQSINKHQAMKASFWRRGVIVKNYLTVIQKINDRDGDGFSHFFDGGDYDDKNPGRNPIAQEIPSNDIDENSFGGDFKQPLPNFAEVNQKPITKALAKNVLFITIDCLRADHLGCYGYSKPLSKNIDQFATKSLVFENGYALGTNTGHSFSGIARANYGEALFDDQIPTLAEVFSQQGYNTAAITSPETSKWLQKEGWESYKTVMLKGFQKVVHEEGGNWNSRKLTEHTIEYLKAQTDKPFFIWVHYNDLHAKAEKYFKQDKEDSASSPMGIYDSNLRFTDKHLGHLLAYLESSGLMDNTVIAISADHGEEFNEHGQAFHNGRPYRVQTHVPVILYYPSISPKRVNQAISTIDFAPTFLRLTGYLPPATYNGVDLIETAQGNVVNRPIFMETPRNVPDANFFAWAVVDGDWRFIYDLVGNTFELYDKKSDPQEQRNLIDKEAQKGAELKDKFGIWLDYQSQDKNYRYWQRF